MDSNDKRAFVYYLWLFTSLSVCVYFGAYFVDLFIYWIFFLPETYFFDLNKAVKIFEFLRYFDKLCTVV